MKVNLPVTSSERVRTAAGFSLVLILLPATSHAQTFAGEIHSLQSVLDTLYSDMMPLCNRLINVGRGLAGFAALWYISSRVWKHLANAEPIEFYPLLRPFVIGFCILIFPYVIALMNGILRPTVTGTAAMVKGSNDAIAYLLKLKEEAIRKTPAWQMYVGPYGDGNRDTWYKYTNPQGGSEGTFEGLSNDVKFQMAKMAYSFRNSVKQWMSEVLHVLYEAAALCINTLRTFYLIVLAILGPLVFGFAVFDGFQNSLTIYLARYISVFLWLPVANIFGAIIGKVQENMLKIDIQQLAKYGETFFSATDTAYLIFLIIGIIGYFTVPSVANYIVHAGGGHALVQKSSNLIFASSQSMISAITKSFSAMTSSSSSRQNTLGKQATSDSASASQNYLHTKLSGNTHPENSKPKP